jgi:hypothetical protein
VGDYANGLDAGTSAAHSDTSNIGGFVTILDDGNNSNNNNKPPNEKATQAYKLFSERKKPVDVAIQLNLSEKEVTRFYVGVTISNAVCVMQVSKITRD